MKKYTRDDVIRICEEQDVEFIRLQFTDILGNFKNMAITVSQLEKALDNKFMFDGASIEGFTKYREPDLCLYPDYSTLEVFPWRPQIYSEKGRKGSGGNGIYLECGSRV